MRTRHVVATAIASVLLAGCTLPATDVARAADAAEMPEQVAVDPDADLPTPDPPAAPVPDPPVPSTWVCVYLPSYDHDWHNDVECSDGVQVERPYLRAWDDFVTEDEIMQSAREYETELNGG